MIAAVARFFLGLTENIGLKLLALLFAVGLFAYQRVQGVEHQRTIPVGVVSRLPPESDRQMLMTQLPANIHVTVRGSTRDIDKVIQTGVAPVELDLRDGKTARVNFEPEMFSLPPDVTITIIDPPSLELEWQSVISRKLPIQASITGKPAAGFIVKGDLELNPTHVTVEGPASLVEVMQFARLAAFDVSGLSDAVSDGVIRRRIAIDDPPARVHYISPRNPRPEVTVTITRQLTERTFQKLIVAVIGAAGATTMPRTVDVTITGPPEILSALRKEQIVPKVDITDDIDLEDSPHGSAKVDVSVELSGAKATKIQPPNVLVRW